MKFATIYNVYIKQFEQLDCYILGIYSSKEEAEKVGIKKLEEQNLNNDEIKKEIGGDFTLETDEVFHQVSIRAIEY
jgi:hypothetical protein